MSDDFELVLEERILLIEEAMPNLTNRQKRASRYQLDAYKETLNMYRSYIDATKQMQEYEVKNGTNTTYSRIS